MDKEALASYEESVGMLADALVDPEIPLYCMRIPKSKAAQERPPTASAVDEASSRLKGIAAEIEADDDLLPKSRIDGAIDRHLDTHAQLQEGLTDELVGLASQLKERTKAVESAVHKRNNLIDSVDDAVTLSAASAAESSKKAKIQHSRCACSGMAGTISNWPLGCSCSDCPCVQDCFCVVPCALLQYQQ